MKINMFEGARRIIKLIAVIWIVGCGYNMFTWNPTIHAYFSVVRPGIAPIRMDEESCDADDAREFFYSKHTSKGTSVSGELCFKPKVFDDGRKLIPVSSNPVPWQDLKTEQLAEWIVANKDKKGTTEFEIAATFYELAKLETDKASALRLGDKQLALIIEKKIKAMFNGMSNQRLLELAANEKGVWGYEKYSTEVSSYTNEVVNTFKMSKSDEDWIDGEVWPARWKNIKEGSLWIIGGVACLYIFSWCVGWIIRGFAGIPLGQDRKPDDM